LVDRSQCTCYKPDESENIEYSVNSDDLPLVSTQFKGHLGNNLYIDGLIEWDETDSNEYNNIKYCKSQITHLSQQDFLYGTYRITQCGNYILDEDIILNFNAPLKAFSYENGDSPNAYNLDDLPWFPTTQQQESLKYFGFNDFWGPFSIGFFAGILLRQIMCLYINLNGHYLTQYRNFLSR